MATIFSADIKHRNNTNFLTFIVYTFTDYSPRARISPIDPSLDVEFAMAISSSGNSLVPYGCAGQKANVGA